jgi:putative ABC transport system permease protein
MNRFGCLQTLPRFPIIFFAMLHNFLKIAYRNIIKYKGYAFISIFSLAIGMTCFLFILLFILDELSFDRYHTNADRIFRLADSYHGPGGIRQDFATSPAPYAPTLKKDFMGIEEAARIFPQRRLVEHKNQLFYEDHLFFADASIFKIFTFPFLKGDPKTALVKPFTVVISEEIASKYFGDRDPLNQVLNIEKEDYIITGLMKNMPKNSHFYADIFVSMKTLEQNPDYQKGHFQTWARHEMYTYLLLHKDFPASTLQAKLPGFLKKYSEEEIKTDLEGYLSTELQPLIRIHLHSDKQFEIQRNSDIKNIYIFASIALFILFIASINFMNLTTARSTTRAKEVSIRKVVGADRAHLIQQFLLESFFFSLIAMIFAAMLFELSQPWFAALTGKSFSIIGVTNLVVTGGLFCIMIFLGLVSGSYPAFILSGFEPARVFRGVFTLGRGHSRIRKMFVIFQFAISIVLIIGTIVILDQLNLVQNQILGFDKSNVLVIPIRTNSIKQNAEALKAELKQNPLILNATITVGVPGGMMATDVITWLEEGGKQLLTVRMTYTDHDFIKTMGMKIIKGRDFSQDFLTDTMEAFIINESMVKELQLKDPLKTRFAWGGEWHGKEKKGRVIGVVKNFQFQSLKSDIDPLVIHIDSDRTRVFAIRIQPDNLPDTIEFIKKIWVKFDPGHPFEFSFLDDTLNRQYAAEEKLSLIFGYFAVLAVIIAALGLFGLIAFIAEQRTKEIGIRKIAGASTGQIFALFTWEFVGLVSLSNIVAWPVAYFIMYKWLQNFAYRVGIRWEIFILAGALAIGIALLTVSYQALKSALSNPVNSLRYE